MIEWLSLGLYARAVLWSALTLALSVVVHEYGHLLALKDLEEEGKVENPSVHWGFDYIGVTADLFQELEDEDIHKVKSWGLYSGAFIIVFACMAFNPLLLLLMFPYLWGARADLDSTMKYLLRNKEVKGRGV